MTYATISELARRWQVDRATARIALVKADIAPSIFHTSPHYSFGEILRKIENVPDEMHSGMHLSDRLFCANQLADHLGVTPQTVRNYGRAGRLHIVKITERTVRYMFPPMRKCKSETESVDPP
ncbi:MAG: hypothetical protein U1A24_16215 [Cypionkella sp.]|uniref:hypothetical protein n=1 Tax=Cypionkella sp. TaxID=2811411 RepID=UPI002AB8BC55|nr:hypothetical protein [Cypionkella sp.]MDZ4312093.1 hypothetical protein [Cypionkella sp.]